MTCDVRCARLGVQLTISTSPCSYDATPILGFGSFTSYNIPCVLSSMPSTPHRNMQLQSLGHFRFISVSSYNQDIATASQADLACIKTDSYCHRCASHVLFIFSREPTAFTCIHSIAIPHSSACLQQRSTRAFVSPRPPSCPVVRAGYAVATAS